MARQEDKQDRPARLAFPLVRYSYGRQGKGDSTRRQEDWHGAVCKQEGWQLDHRFNIVGKAESAFHGDNLKASLGRFLEAINADRVPRGAVLLAEELDRITRQERKKALPLIMGILAAGVDIRTRNHHWTEDSIDDLGEFVGLTVAVATGHDHSRRLSERIGAVWANWRAKAAEGEKVPPPGRLPPWVDWDDGKGRPLGLSWAVRKERGVPFRGFVLVPEAAATVKLAYKLAAQGIGLRGILARFNGQDGNKPVPTISRCPTWRMSSLAKLLNWRAVLGEMEDGTGAIHKGLYPTAVTEAEFYRAREALEGRRIGNKGVGRQSGGVANLFPGLLRDARDGSLMHVIDKGAEGSGRFIISSAYLCRERGAVRAPFPYGPFEEAVLSLLREVDPREVLGQADGPDEVMVLEGRLRTTEDNVAAVNAALDKHGESPEMLARLAKRAAERDRAAAELAAARARAAHPLSESWGEAKTLLEALKGKKARLRFRAVVRRLVKEARVLVVQRSRQDRVAAAQFYFAGGACRSYVIFSRTHCGSGKHRKAPRWRAWSFAEAGLSEAVDLRQAEHSRRLEATLAGALKGIEPRPE
jgi:hypothetical protein